MSPPEVVVDRPVAPTEPAVSPVDSAQPIVSGPALSVRVDGTVPVVRLPEELPDFESLRACVRDQLPAHAAVIGGRSIRLDLGVREIVLFDLRRLLHLLRQEFSMEVTGLYVTRPAIHRFSERELKLKLFPQDEARAQQAAPPPEEAPTEPAEVDTAVEATPLDGVTLPTDLTPADLSGELTGNGAVAQETRNAVATPGPTPTREEGRRTQVIHRTLRSGNVVRFDGDLFVFGDVNPGAQVVATGNITVLGALKGMAHAGAAGDEESFILAFDLRPTQLRIGRKIAIPPDRKSGDLQAEIASVSGDQIILEPYQRRR